MVTVKDLKDSVVEELFELEVTVKKNGVVLDISTATSMTMTVKENLTDTDASAFAQVSGTFVSDGTDGKVLFTILSSTTKNANPDISYYYDTEIVLPGGNIYTPLKGQIVWCRKVKDIS